MPMSKATNQNRICFGARNSNDRTPRRNTARRSAQGGRAGDGELEGADTKNPTKGLATLPDIAAQTIPEHLPQGWARLG